MWVIGVGVIEEMSMASACRRRDVVEIGRRLFTMSLFFQSIQRIAMWHTIELAEKRVEEIFQDERK